MLPQTINMIFYVSYIGLNPFKDKFLYETQTYQGRPQNKFPFFLVKHLLHEAIACTDK